MATFQGGFWDICKCLFSDNFLQYENTVQLPSIVIKFKCAFGNMCKCLFHGKFLQSKIKSLKFLQYVNIVHKVHGTGN